MCVLLVEQRQKEIQIALGAFDHRFVCSYVSMYIYVYMYICIYVCHS